MGGAVAPSAGEQEEAGDRLDLGSAIQHLRGFRKQSSLAAKASITAATWSLYENGRRKPKAINLVRIVRALGCTRLQLEEVVWAFRRRRLAAEQLQGKAWGGALRSGSAAGTARPAQVQFGNGFLPLPPELEEWRALASALLDELLAHLARAGLPRTGGGCA